MKTPGYFVFSGFYWDVASFFFLGRVPYPRRRNTFLRYLQSEEWMCMLEQEMPIVATRHGLKFRNSTAPFGAEEGDTVLKLGLGR